MPRKPNPKTTNQQAYVRGETEEEKIKIKAVKEICARNGLFVRDVLLAGMDKFLKEHNWPPGNSQTLLQVFGAKPKLICFKCRKEFYSLNHVEFISGKKARVCDGCLEDYQERRLVRKVIVSKNRDIH